MSREDDRRLEQLLNAAAEEAEDYGDVERARRLRAALGVDAMDDRNGNLYPNRQAALDAGVPADHVQDVKADVFKVTSGPFKGRLYRRTAHGLVRVKVVKAGRAW